MHDSKGIVIHDWNANTNETHNWTEVAKEIKRLIAMDDYLTDKEREKVRKIGASMPIPRVRIEAVMA